MLIKFILGNKWLLTIILVMMVLFQLTAIKNAAGMQSEQGILAQLNQKLIDIEHVMNDAQALQVNVLSPNVFQEAQKNFEKAKSDLAKGKDVKGISKNLTKAEELLASAIKNAKEAKKHRSHDEALHQARDETWYLLLFLAEHLCHTHHQSVIF